MPRPSLSGPEHCSEEDWSQGVAGVYAPAFVERKDCRKALYRWYGVAGVYAPAFVERTRTTGQVWMTVMVSPGFMPRPSLSDHMHTNEA